MPIRQRGSFGSAVAGGQMPWGGGPRTMEDLGHGNFANTPTWGGKATGHPASFGGTAMGTGTPGAVGHRQMPGMGGYGAPQLGSPGMGGSFQMGGGGFGMGVPQGGQYTQSQLGSALQQLMGGNFNMGQLGNLYGLGQMGPMPGMAGVGHPGGYPIAGPTGQPLADMTGWTQNPTGGGWSRPGPGGMMQGIIA